MRVAVIDYGMGNLFSVQQACNVAGMRSVLTSDKRSILNADGVILPGVGAFGRAMEYLNMLDLVDTITTFIQSGKPFMGICLGMQLLFSESEEFGSTKGLNVIRGKVRKFPLENRMGDKVKVPQIGWNQIYKTNKKTPQSPLKDVMDGEFMYFVHSFYTEPDDQSCILTETNYTDVTYCSSILQENVFATQFHPEKSAQEGIKIYLNWAKIVRKQ